MKIFAISAAFSILLKGGGGQNSCFCIPGGWGKCYMLYITIYI